MKFIVNQDYFLKSLKKGAFAALTDEAQSDSTNVARLVKSIKLTAQDGKLYIESVTPLVASYCILDADNDALTIKEDGSIAIPAKQFVDWMEKQEGANIGINVAVLDTPEIIRDGDIQEQAGDVYNVVKIANVQMIAKTANKSQAKWELDGYDPERMPVVHYETGNKSLFAIETDEFDRSLTYTEFSAQAKDPQHILDSTILEVDLHDQKTLYVASTDTSRCAVYVPQSVKSLNFVSFPDPEQYNGDKEQSGVKVLLPASILRSVLKSLKKNSGGNIIEVLYNADTNRVLLKSGDSMYRMVATNIKNGNKIPSVRKLMTGNFTDLCTIDKKVLGNRLSTVSIVNSSSVLFCIKDDEMTILAKSEKTGYRPSQCVIPIANPSCNVEAVWAVNHIFDVIKVIAGSNVTMSVPHDNKTLLKIQDPNDNKFSYLSRTLNTPLYTN